MIEDAVAKKVDAIVVGFGDMESIEGALKTVAEAGIPLFTVDSGWNAPSICDIASNNYLMGAQMGEYLIQRMLGLGKSDGNICRITANFHHGTRKRGKVFTVILTENEGIKVLDERIIQYEGFFEITLNTVTDWMTQHGDKVDAIWCPWDEPAMAAAQAILPSGRTVKNCFVVGADGHIPAVNRMRDDPDYPMVATTCQSFPLWGNMVAYYVEQIVGLKRPIKEVVPVPIINMPTPLLVKGFNLPPADDADLEVRRHVPDLPEAGVGRDQVEMTNAEPLFEALHISKAYPGVQALNDVSFELRAGEIHALVGVNGAGKSTLVKIMVGAERPDSGTMRLRGRELRPRSTQEAMEPASPPCTRNARWSRI